VYSFKVFSVVSSLCEVFISAGLGGAIRMCDVRVRSVHIQEV
jgi:hypothetical protein